MTLTPYQQRRAEAALAATDLLGELGVDQTQPVDVFSLCEDVGLWLAFVELDGLLGAYLPRGDGGVLITTQRPMSVQRYTAAHELAHWRMNHDAVSLDDEGNVFGSPSREQEQLAQVFAANLLLPPPLVFGILGRVGADVSRGISAQEAYAVAREAGVSYEAAVRQLHSLGSVTTPVANDLLGVRPLAIKATLAHGRRPRYGYADMWPVDERWHDQVLAVRSGDEVLVSLPENRSTGYAWQPEGAEAATTTETPPPDYRAAHTTGDAAAPVVPSPADVREAFRRLPRGRPASPRRLEGQVVGGVEVAGDLYVAARAPDVTAAAVRRFRSASAERIALSLSSAEADEAPIAVGATGRRLLVLRPTQSGPFTVRLQYRSRYAQGDSAGEFVIHGIVEPRRWAFDVEQLAGDEDDAWLDSIRSRDRPLGPIT